MLGKNNFQIKFKPVSERHNLLKTFLRLNPNLTMRGKIILSGTIKTRQREAKTFWR